MMRTPFPSSQLWRAAIIFWLAYKLLTWQIEVVNWLRFIYDFIAWNAETQRHLWNHVSRRYRASTSWWIWSCSWKIKVYSTVFGHFLLVVKFHRLKYLILFSRHLPNRGAFFPSCIVNCSSVSEYTLLYTSYD